MALATSLRGEYVERSKIVVVVVVVHKGEADLGKRRAAATRKEDIHNQREGFHFPRVLPCLALPYLSPLFRPLLLFPLSHFPFRLRSYKKKMLVCFFFASPCSLRQKQRRSILCSFLLRALPLRPVFPNPRPPPPIDDGIERRQICTGFVGVVSCGGRWIRRGHLRFDQKASRHLLLVHSPRDSSLICFVSFQDVPPPGNLPPPGTPQIDAKQ